MLKKAEFHKLGPHFDNYGTPSPLVAPLLHYKFMPDFEKKIEAAIAEGQHWNGSTEYRVYKEGSLIEKTLLLDNSIKVRNGDDLGRYISMLSETIRAAGLSGSIHLQSSYQPSEKTNSTDIEPRDTV